MNWNNISVTCLIINVHNCNNLLSNTTYLLKIAAFYKKAAKSIYDAHLLNLKKAIQKKRIIIIYF